MKVAALVRRGAADKAFKIQEQERPTPKPHELLIKVDAFGLNYADVMARLGKYEDAPALPAVLGYDVVGYVEAVGSDVTDFQVGQRVAGMTRFGGYAEYAVTDARGTAVISDKMPIGVALALTTQCITAYYAAYEMVRLHEGDHVLIQAAAGGVGTALVQIAKERGCTVYGTASTHKLDYLKEQGVDHPIDYRTTDFAKVIKKIRGDAGLDVVFDSVGGSSVKKGYKLLGSGGRLVAYGAAKLSDTGYNIFKLLGVVLGFGIYSPISFLRPSKGMIGVNMLRIADDRPEVLSRCLKEVVKLAESGILRPTIGGEFSADKIGEAHELLGSRKSIGKIIVKW